MAVGISVSKQDVDNMIGSYCRDINSVIWRGQQISASLTALANQLAALGYTANDITAIQSWQTEFALMVQILTGQAALPTQTNFLANISQFFGTGT